MKKLFLLCWLMILAVGYFAAMHVLGTSIELIEQLTLTTSDGALSEYIKHVNYEDKLLYKDVKSDAWSFFYTTYGLFSVTSLIFAALVSTRMVLLGERSQKKGNYLTNAQVGLILLSMLSLMVVGYIVQIGVHNPLQGAVKAYGQPYGFYFTHDANWFSWTNPFIWPSYCWGVASVVFFLNAAHVDVRDEQLLTMFMKSGSDFRSESDFIQACNGVHYRRRFFIAFVLFPIFFLLPSSFVGGVTVLEPLKILLMVGLAGWVTQAVQTRRGDKKRMNQLKWFTAGFGILLIALMLIFLKLLDDLGAGLIIFFAVLLVCFSVVFEWAVWVLGLVLYALAFLLKEWEPEWIFGTQERLGDWALGDYFITSGIRDDYVVGTASSPDFAKALWGIAAGGLNGRGTGLFAQEGRDGFYVASMAFGYNDRTGSALIEIFGWLGLCVVMLLFFGMIWGAITLYQTKEQSFYPRYGLSLGLAALIFGQVVVHFGGNFGFIPFTGMVLPFISHSGSSLLLNMILITMVAAAYLPRDRGSRDAVVAKPSRIGGMLLLIVITMAILLGYAFKETKLHGHQYSTRVRYDVQADKSVKRVVNPRLFLLTDQLSVSGQIVDSSFKADDATTKESSLIKDEHGKYRFEHFNQEDFFLHHFEQEHEYTLKGLTQESMEDKLYYNKICVLKDGEYHQFAGQTLQGSSEKTQELVEEIAAFEAINEPSNEYNCTVQKVRRGRLWNEKSIGVPVDPNDPAKGCKLVSETGSTVVLPYLSGEDDTLDPKHSVWFFKHDEANIDRQFEAYLTHDGRPKVKIYPMSYDDVEDDSSNVCVVATWNTKIEERVGIKTSKGTCSITDSKGKTVKYGRNTIDENQIGRGSARSIYIEDTSEPGQCLAKIERVGCLVDGAVEIDQYTPDVTNGVAKAKVYYGGNGNLQFKDTYCKVSKETMGNLKKLHSGNTALGAHQFYFPAAMERLVSNYEDEIVSLHNFSQSTVKEQRGYMSAFENVVPQTIIAIGLNATLQDKVRGILKRHQERLNAPSVQAMVFDVKTGQILSQAQATKPHSSFQKYMDAKDHPNLFADRGMYGFGRNNLTSSMVPASTFKVLHALAAIEGGFTDFKHKCSVHGYFPEDADWYCPPGKDCTIKDYSSSGKNKGYHEHNLSSTGKTNLSWAITQSCNQYFAALAYNHTHPEILTKVCSQKGLQFGSHGQCELKEPKSRGAASNGWGQELLMDVYQMAGVLQSVSTNYQPYLEPWNAYLYPSQRVRKSIGELDPLFEGEGGSQIETYILKGMYDHTIASGQSQRIAAVRVYGKTGTGDHNIAFNSYKTEREGDFIRKQVKNKGRSNETIRWVEDYEAPYGVAPKYSKRSGKKIASNMAIYVALVEKRDPTKTKKLSDERLGIVVRVPRTETPVKDLGLTGITGGGVAGPIAEEMIQVLMEMELIP